MRKNFFFKVLGLSVILSLFGMNIYHAFDGYGIRKIVSFHPELIAQTNGSGSGSGSNSDSGTGSGSSSCSCDGGCCSGSCNCGGSSSGGSSSGDDSSGGSSSGGGTSGGCTNGVLPPSSNGTFITKICDHKSDPNATITKVWCSLPITNYICYFDNIGNGTPY
jgi:hypothetical protein